MESIRTRIFPSRLVKTYISHILYPSKLRPDPFSHSIVISIVYDFIKPKTFLADSVHQSEDPQAATSLAGSGRAALDDKL